MPLRSGRTLVSLGCGAAHVKRLLIAIDILCGRCNTTLSIHRSSGPWIMRNDTSPSLNAAAVHLNATPVSRQLVMRWLVRRKVALGFSMILIVLK